MALAKKNEERWLFPGWIEPENLLKTFAAFSQGQFVDYETLTCSYDSEAFVSFLHFCRDIKEYVAPASLQNMSGDEVMLQWMFFSSLKSLNDLKREGEDFRFIGFPNEEGQTGSYFNLDEQGEVALLVSQSTADKDAAWQFIRGLYTEEWQMRSVNSGLFYRSLPTLQSAWDLQVKELLEDRETLITEEDFAHFSDAFFGTPYFFFNDDTISQIVTEEGMYFLAGDKTAEDVASVIQSRVSMLLSERQ